MGSQMTYTYNPGTQKAVPKDAIVIQGWRPGQEKLDSLLVLLRRHYWYHLADQIEEQARPAIEEPTELGAVVETADGRRYVRGYNDWEGPDGFLTWSDFTAVRVLSEGVS